MLLFPRGEHGWNSDIPLTLADGEAAFIPGYHEDEDLDPGEEPDKNDNYDMPNHRQKERKTVSQLEYYAYRLHQRTNESDHLFRAKALFCRHIVDGFAQTDQSHLSFLKNNQDKLRVDVYSGVVDAVVAKCKPC